MKRSTRTELGAMATEAAVPRREYLEPCAVCPPWVRCAHWDGQAIQLLDNDLLGTALSHHHHRTRSQRFTVAGPGVLQRCSCADDHMVFPFDFARDSFYADDLPAALVEFHRREAALLGRAE